MSKKRTLIVGDVHGCFDELMELLEKVTYNKSNDRLIFVGDLINKGPSSLKVLEWVKEDGCEVLMGNHELGFVHYVENPNPDFTAFVKLEEQMGESFNKWGEWMKELPLYIDEDFIVVHGGVVPGFSLDNTPAHLITRIRTWDGCGENMNNKENPAWYDLYSENKLVVYGHWAAQGLRVEENTIGLDSGCCWGGKLSLLHLETREVFQVDAKKAYTEI